MKFESSNPSSPEQEDLTHFYSSDPYEVLGVSREANDEEIDRARKSLQRKFHPDINKDPRATAIAQNINAAFDILNDKGGGLGVRGSSRTQQARSTPHEPPKDSYYKQEKRSANKEVESRFLSSLRYNADIFASWVASAKASGITSERIRELIKSPEAQKIIKDKFVMHVKIWKNDVNDCLKYIEGWRSAGIEMGSYFNLPEVKSLLMDEVLRVKIKIWGHEGPDEFINFIKSWKKAGVDLSGVIYHAEVRQFLEEQALNVKIKIWGHEGPREFLKFTDSWKKAGIDLGSTINSPRAQDYLTELANRKLKFSPSDFKPFVQKWMQAGWKPNANTMQAFNK